MAGTPAALALTTEQTVQSLQLRSGAATVFRHPDGNWHARVSYVIRNGGTEPVDLRRESFRVADMQPAGELSTFPEHIALNPGMTAEGDITWWRDRGDPQPRSIVVRYAPGADDAPTLGTQSYTLAFSPIQPSPGNVPTRAVYTLPMSAQGVGLSFVASDGNRHVRVNLRVENTTDAPLMISRAHFRARIGSTEASVAVQPQLTTWGDPALVLPGTSVEGSVGFWVSGDPTPNPASVRVTLGPEVSPIASVDAAVAAGPNPIE